MSKRAMIGVVCVTFLVGAGAAAALYTVMQPGSPDFLSRLGVSTNDAPAAAAARPGGQVAEVERQGFGDWTLVCDEDQEKGPPCRINTRVWLIDKDKQKGAAGAAEAAAGGGTSAAGTGSDAAAAAESGGDAAGGPRRLLMAAIVQLVGEQRAAVLILRLPEIAGEADKLRLRVDEHEPVEVPEVKCANGECVAALAISKTMMGNMKVGKRMFLALPVKDEKAVRIPISLAGFADAFKRLADGGA